MADSTAYDMYMKNLSRVKRMSNQAQRAAQQLGTRQAKASLQGQALLLVAHVFKRMQANDRLLTVEAFDMDALQEANLAAMEALPKWNPVLGTLATWLVPHIKGALLDYANTHTNGGIGSKHNKLIQVAIDEVVASEELLGAPDDNPFAETSEPITLEESLTYEADVLPDAQKETLMEQIRYHAYRLDDGNLLVSHFLHDEPIKDMAKRTRISQATLRRRIEQAVNDLRAAVERCSKPNCKF